MSQTCQKCQQPFEVTEQDLQFYDQVSPVIGGTKLQVPAPTWCSHCREQRRLSWRNERNLYWRKCDATGKQILSVFADDYPGKVFSKEYWYTDQWNPLDYGRDYDFNRPFFDQFRDLMHDVPQLALSVLQNENSDYINQAGWNKDCYLIFEVMYNIDCMYGNYMVSCTKTLDATMVEKCELCYEVTDCDNCFGLKYSQNCTNCTDSMFLLNCIGCTNCFGCVNMRNKQYCFFNEQLTKEAYEERIKQFDMGSYKNTQHFKDKFREYVIQFPQRYYQGNQNENSTGNYIYNTQNCKHCFDVKEAQDCAYLGYAVGIKNSYDINVFGEDVAFCYEAHEVGKGANKVLFCDQVFDNVKNLLYCKLCVSGTDTCFGSMGLKKHKYVILNKQYTQEEYEVLVPKIVEHMKSTGEWGQFFPSSLSPFAYNETIAPYYYSLTEEQAQAKGFKWRQPDAKDYKPATMEIPDHIKDVDESILQGVFVCGDCGKNYKVVAKELAFYLKYQVPVPHSCHDCRNAARVKLRTPRYLWDRQCGKCGVAIKTAYSPQRPEQIYCETCYQGATS